MKSKTRKALFIVTGSEKGTWLSEVTHPYWHLVERGVEVDIFTPDGNGIVWDPLSDPETRGSHEPDDLVSKGFKTDATLLSKLSTTLTLKDADPDSYDVVHIAGGLGATYDLYPNEDVARVLEHFWANGKAIGALCHGVIALANNPDRIRGRRVTGYTLVEDKIYEKAMAGKVKVPHYPQTVLEEAGAVFEGVEPEGQYVVREGMLVTGQNQFSASDYGLVLYHAMNHYEPVVEYADHGAGKSGNGKKMLKVDILIRRNPKMTHEQFVGYWRDNHAKLFVQQPVVKQYVRRYIQSRTVPVVPKGITAANYDGLAELWFDNMDGFRSYLDSENYRDVIHVDELNFNDGKPDLLFSEEIMIMD